MRYYYASGLIAGYLRGFTGRPADADALLAALRVGAARSGRGGGARRAAHHAHLMARHFGVAVTHADIDVVKAAGDANNNWVVTQG